jgi:maltose O-acetyltransferase
MMTRTEKEKMLAGELYNADAPELQAEMAVTYKWLARYNAALGVSASDLRELLLERLATVGEGAMIRPPFHCDYGFNISLGANVFFNFNCVILDVVEVTIGDKTQTGQGFRSSPPTTHAMRLRGPPGWSLVTRSASGVTHGSGAAQ